MLIKEENKDIQSLIDAIDQKASIIRQEKRLKDYPEIEKELLSLYQQTIVPFIEAYILTDIEISTEEETILRDSLLELLNYLLQIIKSTE